MDQNNYDYIMNQGTKPAGILGGGGKKQRIILVVAGALVLIILGVIVMSILSAGNKSTSELLAPVAAAQTDIIEITDIGSKDARETALINKTASVSAVLITQNNGTNSYLGKDAKKIIAPYQNTEYKKELEDAKTSGSFDKEYTAILSNRLDLYRQTLVTAYNQAPTTKLKKELESYYAQIGVLIGEQTTPSTTQ
jgi:hypothetical protein